MDLGLSGSVAVVTGASRGIGLAVVRGLAANDVHVIAGARKSSAELDELARAGRVQVAELDLATTDGPSRLVALAGDRIGILVNNVGAAPTRTGGFLSVTDQDWQCSITLNLLVAVRAIRKHERRPVDDGRVRNTLPGCALRGHWTPTLAASLTHSAAALPPKGE